MKTLYTFTVPVDKDVEKSETKTGDNGETITTKTMVKETSQVEFVIKKPSKYEVEDADIHRAAAMHDFIRRGVMPQAILSKTYGNQGGALTDHEIQYEFSLKRQLYEKTEELKKLEVEKADKALIDTVLQELMTIRNKIIEFQYSQTTFYADTAEAMARTKMIEWYLANLVYTRGTPKSAADKDESEPIPYFKGETDQEKLAYLSKLEDDEDPVYLKMKERALFVIMIFLQLGTNIKAADIDELLKENVSTDKPV